MIKTLGSIKNIDEAQALSNLSFDIVDIKNVDDGSLGYVGDKQIELISNAIANKDISVTAGNHIHPNIIEVENRLSFLCSKGIKFMKLSVLYRDELKPLLPVLSNCFNSFLSESDNFFGSESQSQLGISDGLSPITSTFIPAIFAAISAFQTLGLGK